MLPFEIFVIQFMVFVAFVLAMCVVCAWLLRWAMYHLGLIKAPVPPQAQQTPVYTPPQQYGQNGYQQQYQPKE